MSDRKDLLSAWAQQLRQYVPARWGDFPNIDLYMDQLITYAERNLEPFSVNDEDKLVSSAMINNYVKSGVIPRPNKKRYSNEHISNLLMVCVLKRILSISDISKLIGNLNDGDTLCPVYDDFCDIQEQAVSSVCGKITGDVSAEDGRSDKELLSRLALKYALDAALNQLASQQIINILQSDDGDGSGKS